MALKILVVDDEPLILIAVERALSRVGYFTRKAKNMEELDAVLTESPFDLLITDIYLQDETADSIISRVKETSPSIKVLKMSGSANRETTVNFIEKPFTIDALRKKVSEILNEPS
jgi:DNA-binding NtrC family response regulator